MRSIIVKAGVLAAAFMALGPVSAWAGNLEVEVPFAFTVNGRTLPAGRYTVSDDHGLVEIRGEHGKHSSAFVLTRPASSAEPSGASPVVTFERGEKGYRLKAIWETPHDGQQVGRS